MADSDIVSFANWETMEQAVLALWKSAKPVFIDSEPTLQETKRVINTGYVDYIKGRSLKLGDVKQDWPNLRSNLYNRDNGEGLMESVSKTHIRQTDYASIESIAATRQVAVEAKRLYDELF